MLILMYITQHLSCHIILSNKVNRQTKSDHQTKSDCQTIFFTIDVVTQLAQLVQVDDMGDEEVEHVVTSLASLTIKIKT